jgi:DNA-binding phage protein
MSYELKIDPKRRAAGRFIGTVRKALINAALEEKQSRGLSQQKVAECLGVNRSVINRMLRGEVNLTLRSVAELAWAMGWQPHFSLDPSPNPRSTAPAKLRPTTTG